MSPFEDHLGRSPTLPLDALVCQEEYSVQTATDFRNKLEETFRSATFAQRLEQARQAAYNGKCYTPPRYEVGDEVSLSKKLFIDSSSSVRPSQELSVLQSGSVLRDRRHKQKRGLGGTSGQYVNTPSYTCVAHRSCPLSPC